MKYRLKNTATNLIGKGKIDHRKKQPFPGGFSPFNE
jgi:hypothetical protein